MRHLILLAWVCLCASIWAHDCAPPPPGKHVSDLYYKLCPKQTTQDDEGTANQTPDENRQQTLKEMSKRKGQSNPFTQYPRKDNLYIPPTHNQPWWEQDGQFQHRSPERHS